MEKYASSASTRWAAGGPRLPLPPRPRPHMGLPRPVSSGSLGELGGPSPWRVGAVRQLGSGALALSEPCLARPQRCAPQDTGFSSLFLKVLVQALQWLDGPSVEAGPLQAQLSPAPLPLSPFSPPDRDRRGDSPAWSGRGSRASRRTSG